MKRNKLLLTVVGSFFGVILSHADLVTYLSLDTSVGLTAEFKNSPGGTAAITSGGGGYLGEAATFDAGGYYSVDAGGGIAGRGARTFTAWVKRRGTSTKESVAVGSGVNGDGTKFDLAADSSNNIEGAIGQGRSVTSATIEADEWQFVAVTVGAGQTAGDIISYVNDVEYASNANNQLVNTDNKSLRIGVASNDNTGFNEGYWIGLVDDISIWDEQLTAGELRALYDLGRQLFYTADQFNAMKEVHDAGSGCVVVNGCEWQYSASLRGDAGLNGENTLILDAVAGTGLISNRVSIPEPASITVFVGLLSFARVWLRRRRESSQIDGA